MIKFDIEILFLVTLAVVVIIVFIKKHRKRESFIQKKQNAYPITSKVNIGINNYTGNISFHPILQKINSIIKITKNNLNSGITPIKFNEKYCKVQNLKIDNTEINKLSKVIIDSLNNKLENCEHMNILETRNIISQKAGKQIMKEFDLICDLKINSGNSNNNENYIVQSSNNNQKKPLKDNNLIIKVRIVSTIIDSKQQIYIEELLLKGLTSDLFLPGSNFFDNNNYFPSKVPIIDKKPVVSEDYITQKQNMDTDYESILSELGLSSPETSDINNNTEEITEFFI